MTTPQATQLPWRDWLRHLRVHFNLLLTPIWLFGLTIGAASTGVSNPLTQPSTWLAWASLHLFLYGGTTAFNSYYDRDEGPVGGMLHPPGIDPGLLPFSLVVQAIGLALALPVGVPFTLAWLTLFAVFTAYSHPAVRLKAHPVSQLAAIGLGQGAVGFALGWLVVASPSGLASPGALLHMLLTALIVLALYIVTQSYQVEEDGARGDRTLPVLLGAPRALRLAVLLLAPGGGLLLLDVYRLAGAGLTLTTAVAFTIVGGWMLTWAARFDARSTGANYGTAMRVAVTSGVTLGAILIALLLR